MDELVMFIYITYISNVVVGCHCIVVRTSFDFDIIDVELN